MKTDRVTCEYCAVLNPPDGKRCIACGAPLPVKSTPPLRVTVVDSPPLPLADAARLEPPSISQPLKEGASVVAAGLGALGVGTILLRGSAQIIAVAVAGFIIGINTGQATIITRTLPLMMLLALSGGALTGLCVGLVNKRAFWSLISAPGGALLGTVLAIFLSLNKIRNVPWLAIFAITGAVLFALLGGRPPSRKSLRCLQIIRPVAGMIIGLLFSLFGFLVMYHTY